MAENQYTSETIREIIGMSDGSNRRNDETEERRTENKGNEVNELGQLMKMMCNDMKKRDDILASLVNQVSSNSNNFQVMPDLTKNVSSFDGSGNAREWIEKNQEYDGYT